MVLHSYHQVASATATGVVKNISGANAPSGGIPLPAVTRSHVLQVTGTGAVATSWDVVLEGSLDGTSWTVVCEHSSANGNPDSSFVANNGAAHQQAWPSPVLFVRLRVVSLTLGSATALKVVIMGDR